MSRGKRLLGVLLIAISIGALFSWEKWGRQAFMYDEVLVLRSQVERGEVITEDMLMLKAMEAPGSDVLREKDIPKILGKETGQWVHAGVPLFKEYFSAEDLSGNEKKDRYILSVPEEWVASCPKDLSRGDRVYFYCEGEFVTASSVVASDREDRSFDVVVSAIQTAALSKLAAQGKKLVISHS